MAKRSKRYGHIPKSKDPTDSLAFRKMLKKADLSGKKKKR